MSHEINLADGNIREIHRLRGLLAAAEERAERAETERKAWAEIGAKAQADAAVLRQALEIAMPILEKHEPCGYYCDESVGHVDHPATIAAAYALNGSRSGATFLAEIDQLQAALTAAQVELDRSQPIVLAAARLAETIRGDGNGRCWCRAHEADQLRSVLEKARLA